MAKAITLATDKAGKISVLEQSLSAGEQVKKLSGYRAKGMPKGAVEVQVIPLGQPLSRLSQAKIDAQAAHNKKFAAKAKAE